MRSPPAILLAFANDWVDDKRHLRSLLDESKAIGDALGPLVDAGLFLSPPIHNATVDDVIEAFRERRRRARIRVFHFGGHASGSTLLFEDEASRSAPASSKRTPGAVPAGTCDDSTLKAVPSFVEVEIVKESDGLERIGEVTAATAMVTQDAPVLETSNCVLDACSTSTMSAPPAVAQDLVSAKHRCDELGDGAVSTVGQDATMLLAACFDGRASVVHRVVAVAWTARGGGDDPKIASADQHLGVA